MSKVKQPYLRTVQDGVMRVMRLRSNNAGVGLGIMFDYSEATMKNFLDVVKILIKTKKTGFVIPESKAPDLILQIDDYIPGSLEAAVGRKLFIDSKIQKE